MEGRSEVLALGALDDGTAAVFVHPGPEEAVSQLEFEGVPAEMTMGLVMLERKGQAIGGWDAFGPGHTIGTTGVEAPELSILDVEPACHVLQLAEFFRRGLGGSIAEEGDNGCKVAVAGKAIALAAPKAMLEAQAAAFFAVSDRVRDRRAPDGEVADVGAM